MIIRIIVSLALSGVETAAFQSLGTSSTTRHAMTLSSTPYGRGAAIWPESSQEPIVLADSFPGGILPDVAQDELRMSVNEEPSVAVIDRPKRRRRLPQAIQRILRKAAVKEEDVEYDTSIDKSPLIMALALLVGGLVQPIDILIVAFLSGYLTILGLASRAMRADGITPMLPSLPPQGHVPALVSNPLGNAFTNSNIYDLWLKFGTVFGVIAPTALLGMYLLVRRQAARCCQILCSVSIFTVLPSCQWGNIAESHGESLIAKFLAVPNHSSSYSLSVSEGPTSDSHTCSYCLQRSKTSTSMELGACNDAFGVCRAVGGSNEFHLLGVKFVWLSLTDCVRTIHESSLFQCRS